MEPRERERARGADAVCAASNPLLDKTLYEGLVALKGSAISWEPSRLIEWHGGRERERESPRCGRVLRRIESAPGQPLASGVGGAQDGRERGRSRAVLRP